MRISSLQLFEQLKKAINTDVSELADLNLRLATGKKINRPSDDPARAVRALDYKVNISLNDQLQRNIQSADLFLNATDTAITSGQNTVAELKKLITAGINTMDQTDRDFYSRQAAGYRDFLLNISNTRFGGRHIFSGFHTDIDAFSYNSATNHYAYNGDMGAIEVPVDRGAVSQMNMQGSRVFSVVMDSPTPTALADGTPISYAQSMDPNTGINTMTVTIGNPGDPAYDTFEISNLMDVANYASFAWKSQDVDGTALDAIALISDQKAMHRLQSLYPVLEEGSTQMLKIQSEIGTRQVFLNDQKARLEGHSLSLENARAKTEDADINETVVDIKKAEVALEALRASSANVMSKSLFDFLG